MTYDQYLAIKGCYYQYVVPQLNDTGVDVYCLRGVDTSKLNYTEYSKHCTTCNAHGCKDRTEIGVPTNFSPLKSTSKDITENIISVTDAAICHWAYLYWMDELAYSERTLAEAIAEQDEEEIFSCLDDIAVAKKVMTELYNKLIQMPEIEGYIICKPEWMDECLNN